METEDWRGECLEQQAPVLEFIEKMLSKPRERGWTVSACLLLA